MDKCEIANNLVKLHSDYKLVSARYGATPKPEYSEAVAQAILLLNQTKKGGAE